MSVKSRLEQVWKQYPDPRVWYWTRWFFGLPRRKFDGLNRSSRTLLDLPDEPLTSPKRLRSGEFNSPWFQLDLFPFTDSVAANEVSKEEGLPKVVGDDGEVLEIYDRSINWEAIEHWAYTRLTAYEDRVIGEWNWPEWEGVPEFTREHEKLVPWLARNINRLLKKPNLAIEEGLVPSLPSGAAIPTRVPMGALTNHRLMVSASETIPFWSPATLGFLTLISAVRIQHLLDWISFDSNHAEGAGRPDLNKYHFLEAMAAANEAHQRMAALTKAKRLGPAEHGLHVYKIEEHKGASWDLYHLDTWPAYQEESDKMGHCIGLSKHYFKNFEAGAQRAFSIRREKVPFVTFNLKRQGTRVSDLTERQVEEFRRSGKVSFEEQVWELEQLKLYHDAQIGDSYIHDGDIDVHPMWARGGSETVLDYTDLCHMVGFIMKDLQVEDFMDHPDMSWCRGQSFLGWDEEDDAEWEDDE